MWKSNNSLSLALIVAVAILFPAFSFASPVSEKVNVPYGNYTVSDRKTIQKFRSLLGDDELYKDYMRKDEYLIRWLRDQNFDLDRAREKLLRSLKWRKENNIDNVLREDYSDVEKLCHYDLTGIDKFGRPVLTVSIGGCPLRKVVVGGTLGKLRRMFYYGLEKCALEVRTFQAEGKFVEDIVLIANANSFNWREHVCLQCISYGIEFLTIYQDHYPEFLHALHIINVPRAFARILDIVGPILTQRSKAILHVYGFDKDEWKPAILKEISPDQIEVQFGGTKPVKPFSPRQRNSSLSH